MGDLGRHTFDTATRIAVAYLASAIVAAVTLGPSPVWLLVLTVNFLLVLGCALLSRVAADDGKLSSRTEALGIGISTMAPLGTQTVQSLLQWIHNSPPPPDSASVIGAAVTALCPSAAKAVYIGILLGCTALGGALAVIGAFRAKRDDASATSHWIAITLLTLSILLLQPWPGGVVGLNPSPGAIDDRIIAVFCRFAGILTIGALSTCVSPLIGNLNRAARLSTGGRSAYFTVVMGLLYAALIWIVIWFVLQYFFLPILSLERFSYIVEMALEIICLSIVVMTVVLVSFGLLKRPMNFSLAPENSEPSGGRRLQGDNPKSFNPGFLWAFLAIGVAAILAKILPELVPILWPLAKLLAGSVSLIAAVAFLVMIWKTVIAPGGSILLAKMVELFRKLATALHRLISTSPRLSLAIVAALALLSLGPWAWFATQHQIVQPAKPAGNAPPPPVGAKPEQPPAHIRFEKISLSCISPYWVYGRADSVSAQARDCGTRPSADILIAIGSATPRGGEASETDRSRRRGEELALAMTPPSGLQGEAPRIYVLNRGIESYRNKAEPRTGPRMRALAGWIVPAGAAISDREVADELALFLRGADDPAKYSLCELYPYFEGRPSGRPGSAFNCMTEP